MLQLRRSNERGFFDHGWLQTYHTFSFADYYDPRYKGFGSLRVINEDRVAPGGGFPEHSHQNMEIVTCIVEGALEHRDSMGNSSVIRAGEVQRMSAGTGVRHSEYNASTKEAVHLLQIWILPREKGLVPGYEQKRFEPEAKKNCLRLIVSPDGRSGSLTVHQDAYLYDALLEKGKELSFQADQHRRIWIQVVSGTLAVGETRIETGDGAALEQPGALNIRAVEAADFILFDLV